MPAPKGHPKENPVNKSQFSKPRQEVPDEYVLVIEYPYPEKGW
tara:strand:- start:326 stop:454 length:129 start_codon:yes stop_codon:yes gene_type:complete